MGENGLGPDLPQLVEEGLGDVEAQDALGQAGHESGRARAELGRGGGGGARGRCRDDAGDGQGKRERRGRLERRGGEPGQVARLGQGGLDGDAGQGNKDQVAVGMLGDCGFLAKSAAHQVGAEVSRRAQELAPLKKTAVGIPRREERDVEAYGQRRHRERPDQGAGLAKAPPGGGDDRRHKENDQVDPYELEAAKEPRGAVLQQAAKRNGELNRHRKDRVESDRRQKRCGSSRRRLELGRVETGGGRGLDRTREQEVARDHEEDAVAPRAQQVDKAQASQARRADLQVDVQPACARDLGKPWLQRVEEGDARDGAKAQQLDPRVPGRRRGCRVAGHGDPLFARRLSRTNAPQHTSATPLLQNEGLSDGPGTLTFHFPGLSDGPGTSPFHFPGLSDTRRARLFHFEDLSDGPQASRFQKEGLSDGLESDNP